MPNRFEAPQATYCASLETKPKNLPGPSLRVIGRADHLKLDLLTSAAIKNVLYVGMTEVRKGQWVH